MGGGLTTTDTPGGIVEDVVADEDVEDGGADDKDFARCYYRNDDDK